MRHSRAYRAYLRGPRWARKRAGILRRAGRICERCRQHPASQVHHLTYARLGHERDTDLQALCKKCHRIADRERKRSPWPKPG